MCYVLSDAGPWRLAIESTPGKIRLLACREKRDGRPHPGLRCHETSAPAPVADRLHPPSKASSAA